MVFFDLRCNLRRVGAKIFLVDTSLLVHHERHHAGATPFVGISDQGITGNHVSVDDVVIFSAGSVRSLLLQDLEIVSVIGSARRGAAFSFSVVAAVLGLPVLVYPSSRAAATRAPMGLGFSPSTVSQ